MDPAWAHAQRDRRRRRRRRRSSARRGRRGGAGAHRRARSRAQCLHRRDRASARSPRAEAIDAARARRPSRSGRSPACRSRSRTCSTSRACRRSPARRSTATVPPAARDATLIERLEAAGAVLVGALNMGEYAYDFTGENVHDGAVAQSARHRAHDRRLVRRLGRRGRRRPGAARARLRHQRLDPRAVVALRHVRPEADLRPAVARAHAFRSWRASIISGRSRARRSDLALAYDAMQGHDPRRPGLRRPAGRAGAAAARARHSTACASRSPAAISARARSRRRSPRSSASPRRSASRARSSFPKRERARAAAYVITATEGAALHLDRLRTRARDFDPAVRDRLIAGAMVPAALVDQGAEIPPLVSRAGARAVQARSTPSSRRRRPAPRRRSASRPSCSTASSCRCAPISASTPSRSRSSACRWWRCRCRSSRCRSACRSSRRRGGRTWRCASRMRSRQAASWPRATTASKLREDSDGDRPARGRRRGDEPRSSATRQALVSNDVATLDALFRDDPRTIRYGGGENPLRLRRDRGVPRRALAGRPGAHDVARP